VGKQKNFSAFFADFCPQKLKTGDYLAQEEKT